MPLKSYIRAMFKKNSKKKGAHQLSLLMSLTMRDFHLRYLGSVLGSYWNLIHPVVMILIYTLVFSQVMRARLGSDASPFSYSLYLCSGLLAWNFFSEVVNRCTSTILDNAGFIKKISMSPVIIFGATLCSGLINFVISFSIFSIVLFFLRPVSFSLYLSYLVVFSFLALFAFGIGMALGCLNVLLRDIQQLLGVVFQLWFWFTPIVYLPDALPHVAQKLMFFNPAYPFIRSLQDCLYFHQFPQGTNLLLMLFWACLALLSGFVVYLRSISFVKDQL